MEYFLFAHVTHLLLCAKKLLAGYSPTRGFLLDRRASDYLEDSKCSIRIS
jgi:hypothetical protein